jgi:hypothetical protein
MTEQLIAKDLTVTCSDGSCHCDVVLLLRNGKRVYRAHDGQRLCVEKLDGGVFLVSPMAAAMIMKNCPMEET